MTPPVDGPHETAAWVERLHADGDWEGLISASQLLRVQTADSEPSRLVLASAYAHVGRHDEAEALWSPMQDGPSREWVLLHRAATADDPWLAIAWHERHLREYPQSPHRAWADGHEGRARLQVGDVDGAREALVRAVGTADAMPPRVRRRHAALGAIASALVPGLGQAINAQPVEAASSLVVVGGLAAGTGWAIAEEQPGTAAIVGAVGFLFWAGNVYGGGESALRFNRARMHEVEARWDAAAVPGHEPAPLPPLWVDPG